MDGPFFRASLIGPRAINFLLNLVGKDSDFFVLYALFHYGLFAELLSSLCNIWAAKPKRLDRIKNPLAM